MARKEKYYLTRERLEHHPVVLLLDKYGRMSLNQLFKCLGKNQILTVAEMRQREWIESEIEKYGSPMPNYEEKRYLFDDLKRLRYQGMVQRINRGIYEARPRDQRNPIIPDLFNYQVGKYRQRADKKNMRYGGYIEAKPVSLRKKKEWDRIGWPFISINTESHVHYPTHIPEHKKGHFYLSGGSYYESGVTTTSLEGICSLISPYGSKQILFIISKYDGTPRVGGVPQQIRKAFRENNMRLSQKAHIVKNNGTFTIVDSGNRNRGFIIQKIKGEFSVSIDHNDIINNFKRNADLLVTELIADLRPFILERARCILRKSDGELKNKESVMQIIEDGRYYIDLYEEGWKIQVINGNEDEQRLAQEVVDLLEVPIISGLICPLPRIGNSTFESQKKLSRDLL